MKTNFKYILFVFAALPALTSCIKEEDNADEYLTIEKVRENDASLQALNTAIAKQLVSVQAYVNYGICGYPGMMLTYDVMAAQIPVYDPSYDYFAYPSEDTYLGPGYSVCGDYYRIYLNISSKANLTIGAIENEGELTSAERATLGNALAYRAFAYMNNARTVEYKLTGYSQLDDEARQSGILGLTVPIVTEKTTEADSRNNPRVPFYHIYRFIFNDLNDAEEYLDGITRASANQVNLAVVYGLKARLWLELGTRFEHNPEDLQAQISHENDADLSEYAKLGITTANECYAKAAEYARKAINEGYTPLTQSQWFNAETGFNSVNTAWLWAIQIGSDDMNETTEWAWKNFISFISPEASFGVANTTYNAIRMIDKALYERIEAGDWRKNTWISPSDAGKTSAYGNYETILTASEWAELPAYAGLKYHPAKGGASNYKTGAAVDIPLMRVEEMYLIEAEALAHTQGLEAGKTALKDFVTTYRFTDDSYEVYSNDINEFTQEVIRQKRIEFWGEGIVMFDYKRLAMNVQRAYANSNHPEAYQYNYKDGYVVPHMNICIPNSEAQYNTAIINNPDPSGVY